MNAKEKWQIRLIIVDVSTPNLRVMLNFIQDGYIKGLVAQELIKRASDRIFDLFG